LLGRAARDVVMPPMTDDAKRPAAALAGIRVIDLADELAAYASRLLCDLGAEVIRVEPPGGARTRHAAPIMADDGDAAGQPVSAFELFVNAGKRSIVLDLETVDGRELLRRLIATADILIETWSMADADRLGLTPQSMAEVNPSLVHVSVTPFGRDRAREQVDDDDLTIMAAGGLLNLGGYPDSAPVAAYGGQSRNAASLFSAVAALVALLGSRTSGQGQWVDVSAQECVAQALEDSVVTFELTGRVRKRHGSDAAEAGTGMYPCADGLVSMVAGRVGTARAWQALIAWLVESGAKGAAALQDPAWSDLSYRQTQAAIHAFSTVFGDFTRTRTRQELYAEAQRRGIALSPVNDVRAVLADPQLAARGFWVSAGDAPEHGGGGDGRVGRVGAAGRAAIFPGPPYRLSATPATTARPAPALGADTAAILADLGLAEREVEELREAGIA
jgi:benzylsuccinate CoA-transferase BbsE subunit